MTHRQSWYDSRLSFTNFVNMNTSKLSLNWSFLDTIWKPDTYVVGGRRSFLHSVTSPNRLVRLEEDGRISYSQRLTIASRCKLDLRSTSPLSGSFNMLMFICRKFPMDKQTCRVELSSFGYTTGEVVAGSGWILA